MRKEDFCCYLIEGREIRRQIVFPHLVPEIHIPLIDRPIMVGDDTFTVCPAPIRYDRFRLQKVVNHRAIYRQVNISKEEVELLQENDHSRTGREE